MRVALEAHELDELAEALAERVAARVVERLRAAQADDGWIDSQRAAIYLGISRSALHKLTASRAIPFEQSAPGAKCWFKRSDLDAWRGS